LLLGFIVALLIALFIGSALFQLFSMPSGSMEPTLLIGDYLFVAKYPYGYSRFSLPSSPPLFSGRIFAAEPRRGDVVVFRLSKDETTDYVRRIVGLPGDRIKMIGGVLNINGVAVARERINDFIDGETGARVRRWRETLPNGVSHDVLDLQDNGFLDNTQEYAVPAGHYFVMGDNLDNSLDSRVLSRVGYVPFETLIGRVEMICFSTRPSSKEQPAITRSERIGKLVR
jgi:signal peptidase I